MWEPVSQKPGAAGVEHVRSINTGSATKCNSDLSRHTLRLKVTPDGISYLVLEFSQILALRCDPAFTSRSIPKGDEKSRLLARLGLEDYFVHAFTVESAETRSQIS